MRKKNWLFSRKKIILSLLAGCSISLPALTLTGCLNTKIAANGLIYVTIPDKISELKIASPNDVSEFIAKFNSAKKPDKIEILYQENSSLTPYNTESIEAYADNYNPYIINFDIKLNANYISKSTNTSIDAKNSFTVNWEFGILDLPSEITNHLTISNANEIDTYIEKFNSISSIEDKIATLFAPDSSLNATNTKSIDAKANGNNIEFALTLSDGFLIKGSNNSQVKTYTYKCATILIDDLDQSLTQFNDYILLPTEYVNTFNKLSIDQKIEKLLGGCSNLNTTNVNDVIAKTSGSNHIIYAVTLNQGYLFKNSQKASVDIDCTYSRSLPADFIIPAYGDNEVNFKTNFDALTTVPKKLNFINIPFLSNNENAIDSIEVSQQGTDQKYGYQVTLNSNTITNETTPSSYFFPFNGTGKLTKTIPSFKLKQNMQIQSYEAISNYIAKFNIQFPTIDNKLNFIANISEVYPNGLSEAQVESVNLSDSGNKIQFEIKLKNGFNFDNNLFSTSNKLDVNYLKFVNNLNLTDFYRAIVLPSQTDINGFITTFNNKYDLNKKMSFLLKNPSKYKNWFTDFTASQNNENPSLIEFQPKFNGIYLLLDQPIKCSAISQDLISNFFDKYSKSIKTQYQVNGYISLQNITFDYLWKQIMQENLNELDPLLISALIVEIANITQNANGTLFSAWIKIDASIENTALNQNTNYPLLITINNNQFNYTNIINSFNNYNQIANSVANLIDKLSRTLIPVDQTNPTAYTTINLKKVLGDVAGELSTGIIKITPGILNSINSLLEKNGIFKNYALTPNQFRVVLNDIFANKTLFEIATDFLSASLDSEIPSLDNPTLYKATSIIALQAPKMIKLIAKKINDFQIMDLMKKPLVVTLNTVDGGLNIDFSKILDEFQPFTTYLMSQTDKGILDLVGSALGVAIKGNYLSTLFKDFKISYDSNALTTVYNELYPFQPLDAQDINYYPTNSDIITTASTQLTLDQQASSVGFNSANCAYRNLVSPNIFIDKFFAAFLKNTTDTSKSVQITAELIQTLAGAGLIIDNTNVNKYIQFTFNNTDSSNPYISMIINDDKGTKLTNSVETYISLKNLNAYGNDKNWIIKKSNSEDIFNPSYQGGLFNVSLYDKILGNKKLADAILNLAYSFKSEVVVPPSLNLIINNGIIPIGKTNLIDVPPESEPALKTAIKNIFNNIDLTGKNVYYLINSILGKIETTENFNFAKNWILDNSPYTIGYDQEHQQYVYTRTYNFGTVDKPNTIGNLDLKSLKTLLSKLTAGNVLDLIKAIGYQLSPAIMNLIKDFGINNWLISDVLNDKFIIPNHFGLTDNLYLDVIDTLDTNSSNLLVSQTIDLSNMNNVFDYIVGGDVSGENPNSTSIVSWFYSLTLLPFVRSSISDGKTYYFTKINWTISIDFIKN